MPIGIPFLENPHGILCFVSIPPNTLEKISEVFTSRVAPSPGVLHDVKLATFFIIILPGTRQASWGKK